MSAGFGAGPYLKAAWHEDLSDHACLLALPIASAHRSGDCQPHRLRSLPQAAWADLRRKYVDLSV
eukprot:2084646-Alexandrium_andersonii.AAC.1